MRKYSLLLVFCFLAVSLCAQSSKNYLSELKSKIRTLDAQIDHAEIKTNRKGNKVMLKHYDLGGKLLKTEVVYHPGSPDEVRMVKAMIFEKSPAVVQYRGQKVIFARYPSANGRTRIILYYGKINHQWEEDGNRKGKFRKPGKPQ